MSRYIPTGVLASALSLMVAATTYAASPVEDVEEHFARIDRDQSGGLSKGEIGAFGWGRYDSDGDGVVSRAEFIAGRNGDRQQAATAGRTERAWLLLDWNEDGFLSGTELDGKWERFDTDGNGRVTKAEFLGSDNPPPVDNVGNLPKGAGKSLWGKSVGAAKKSDLFTFFHLEQMEGAVVLANGARFDFRPTAAAFRDLVVLQVLADGNQRIKSVELLLARSFIDDPKNGVFARDIAKSLLAQVTPDADVKQVQDLINEIQYGGAGQRIVVGNQQPPQLPNPPTPGYETFLGQRERYDAKLGVSQLTLWNMGGEQEKWLRISIAPKGKAEEPRS